MKILTATIAEAAALTQLVNKAYRGEASRQGWTTEAGIIGGEIRIRQEEMEKMMNRPGARFLQAINEEGTLLGCVLLEKRKDQLYLGMLTVDPLLQARGTGRLLLEAAEIHARELNCHSIIMRVINLREELIAWYWRRGYANTGNTENYTAADDEKIIRPFHFVILQKNLPAE